MSDNKFTSLIVCLCALIFAAEIGFIMVELKHIEVDGNEFTAIMNRCDEIEIEKIKDAYFTLHYPMHPKRDTIMVYDTVSIEPAPVQDSIIFPKGSTLKGGEPVQ